MVVRCSHEHGTVIFVVTLETGHSVVMLKMSQGRVVLLQIGQVTLAIVQLLVVFTCGQRGQVTLAVTLAHKLQFSVALNDGQIGQLAFTTVMFCTITVRFSHWHGNVTFVKFAPGGHNTETFCVTQLDVELHNSHVKFTLNGST